MNSRRRLLAMQHADGFAVSFDDRQTAVFGNTVMTTPRRSQVVALLVLLTCVVCPILETFDQWDHTAQTGVDTEYVFVAIALCVGIVYAFPRFLFALSLVLRALGVVAESSAHEHPPEGGGSAFFVVPIPLGARILSLRI